jgi:general secretion pathway protein A
MYLAYYELKTNPFRTDSDPEFLWFGEKYKEALSLLKFGILNRGGFLLLTGDVGTGKTSLIRYFLKLIDSSVLVATIHDPDMPAIDFFNYLSEEFKMNRVFSNKDDFLIHFKNFLLKAYSDHKSIIVIIDEAQRLNHEHLEEIRFLSNIEVGDQKLISIFFIGQSGIEQTLMDERNKALSQRIRLSYNIQPLDESETVKYIAHRLRIAGSKRGIFTVGACKNIFSISGGVPRLINSICDCALMSGFAEDRKVVDSKLINECQIELSLSIGTIGEHKKSPQDS